MYLKIGLPLEELQGLEIHWTKASEQTFAAVSLHVVLFKLHCIKNA